MDGLNQQHVALVAKNHTRYSIRGGTGLIFALITVLSGLMIGSILVDPIEQLQKEQGISDAEVGVLASAITERSRPIVQWVTDASDLQLDYWLNDNPALVSAFLFIFAMLVPFLACLGAFNQLSGDIGSRGIRYLLLRIERSNLFFGRFIGTAVFSLLVYLSVFVVVGLFFVFKVDFYTAGAVVLWMGRGLLVICVYTLPFIALSSWISSAVDSPFGSLALSYLFIGGTPLLIWIAGRSYEPAGNLSYGTPWGYRQWLFDPSIGKALAAVGIMLAFTGVFLFMGNRHFDKRDL